MSDDEIVKAANKMARCFYKAMGYKVKPSHKFYKAHHPQEVLCWNFARIAFDKLLKTDIDDAVINTEELSDGK